ncbi:MAG: leucine-rich repeat domain-containing protein [Treponema sp.]|nr:leucine-rich repeat domain-containing protein [Treponema sp.]
MMGADKENLSQEEIDEVVKNLPPDAEMPEVNNSDYELLSQEEIDMLMAHADEVPDEAESELRRSLISLRDTIGKYSSLLYKIEKLSDVEHGFLIAEGEVEEPYWAEKLTKEQKKKFDETLVELKQLPEEINAAGKKVTELAVSGGLSKIQLAACNDVYVQVASKLFGYSYFIFCEKIQSLPADQLEQVCATRLAVLLTVRHFFKQMFSLETKSPLLSKELLHVATIQDNQSCMESFLSDLGAAEEYRSGELPPPKGTGLIPSFAQVAVEQKGEYEERWQQFFEGKATSPYYDYYADTVLSLSIAALNLRDNVWRHLDYLGIGTLEDLCSVPYEKLPALQDEMDKIGQKGAVGEISNKLASLGLCFETSKEDLLAVCAFPLVIKHYGGAGFYELEHPVDRLGTREIIKEGEGKIAERTVEFAMIGNLIDMILDLGGTLMHVPRDTKEFKIPFGYTTIASVAFAGCKQLEKITISNEVYNIGAFAFELPSLKELCYEGSVDEWESIDKDLLWNFGINVPFVKCSDGNADCALCIKDGELLSCAKYAVNVEIPDDVCKIADRAFEGCEKLESVKISDSVQEIGAYAFRNCCSLKEIKLPEALTEIAQHTFEQCSALESFCCPKNLKLIGGYAFYNCQNLETLELNEGLVEIGYCSFQRCLSLAGAFIPASVTSIKKDAFECCSLYLGFTVAEENQNFSAEDGILYSKDKKILIRCPCGWNKGKTEIVISQNVESFCENAFSVCAYIESVIFPPNIKIVTENLFDGCDSLKSVLLPEKVEKICNAAFIRCKSLESITIPSSIKKIEGLAFRQCEKLKEIHFTGTVEEWRKVIRIHDFAEESSVSEVVCTDGNAELGNDKEDWERW